MNTFSGRVSTTASSTSVSFSKFRSNVIEHTHIATTRSNIVRKDSPFTLNTTATLEISGWLSDKKRLVRPLAVIAEYDDGEFIVSEPRFSIHGSGSTLEDALSAFRRMFSQYFDMLTSESENLDAYMLDQLEYLRSYIDSVSFIK